MSLTGKSIYIPTYFPIQIGISLVTKYTRKVRLFSSLSDPLTSSLSTSCVSLIFKKILFVLILEMNLTLVECKDRSCSLVYDERMTRHRYNP